MRAHHVTRALTLVLGLLMVEAVQAWGHQGHETVGALASLLIKDSNAERQLKKILQPGESLSSAAEWPDCAKGFSYCRAEPTVEMKAFVHRNPADHAYHYTDIPFQLKEYSPTAIGAGPNDVVGILHDSILVLQGKPPANPKHNITQREALFLVAHMTGDIHQPLHVGAAYLSSDNKFIVPRSAEEAAAGFTEGGNLLCRGSKNMHSLWDGDLVVRAMRKAHVTTPEAFANVLLMKAKQFNKDSGLINTWPDQWATEALHLSSVEIAPIRVTQRRKAGAGRASCGAADSSSTKQVWDVQLPAQYLVQGADTAANQLAKAGARLARILQEIWP
jgi:hypothetical protein